MYTRGIVRRPGRNFAGGITTAKLGKPDFGKALEQHAAYCEALIKCGVKLTVLEADDRYPDGCFVEDTAVVNNRVKVVSRPGAPTRLGEEEAIIQVLAGYGPTEAIIAPGTMEEEIFCGLRTITSLASPKEQIPGAPTSYLQSFQNMVSLPRL